MQKFLKIEDIENRENKEIQLVYEDFINGIKSKAPIRAELNFKRLGEFIKVTGHISGFSTFLYYQYLF